MGVTKTMKIIQAILISLCVFFAPLIWAKNIGVIGEVYPIAEFDLLVWMTSKAKALVDSGQWQKIMSQRLAEMKHYAERPSPVEGLSATTQRRSWFYEPSLVMPKNASDSSGHVLIAAGTKLNPLDKIKLDNVLIFYDGDNPGQTDWVKQEIIAFKGQVKLILVNGSVPDQQQKTGERVYFDQAGAFVKRFGIQHIPAMVIQEGNQLKVTEIKP